MRKIRFVTIHLCAFVDAEWNLKVSEIDLVPLNGMFIEYSYFFCVLLHQQQ